MILNPVIQGGGAEKEYKITLEANISVEAFPSKAKAGDFILANVVSMRAITQSGRAIPYDSAKWEGCTFNMGPIHLRKTMAKRVGSPLRRSRLKRVVRPRNL